MDLYIQRCLLLDLLLELQYVRMLLLLESLFQLKQDIQSIVALLSIACYILELCLDVWIKVVVKVRGICDVD